MSAKGYLGRKFQIIRNGEILAACRTKNVTYERSPIDRTNEEKDGWRHIDPARAGRSVHVTAAGVSTINNFALLRDDWLGNEFVDIAVRHPDGTIVLADDGAVLESLAHTGEHDGFVGFEASWLLSGMIVIIDQILLTTRPYPVEISEALYIRPVTVREGPNYSIPVHSVDSQGEPISGTLESVLIIYDDWPPESIDIQGEPLSGELRAVLIVYDDWPPESIDVQAEPVSGTLREARVSYDEWPIESIDVQAEPLSGTLTTP